MYLKKNTKGMKHSQSKNGAWQKWCHFWFEPYANGHLSLWEDVFMKDVRRRYNKKDKKPFHRIHCAVFAQVKWILFGGLLMLFFSNQHNEIGHENWKMVWKQAWLSISSCLWKESILESKDLKKRYSRANLCQFIWQLLSERLGVQVMKTIFINCKY